MKIILATKNEHKLKEINEFFKEKFQLFSLKDVGFTHDILEDGETYEENALKKAIEVMKFTNEISMADDSGLEIDFLDKKPGVYSGRFLGENTPYSVRIEKILEKMKDVPLSERTARFVCALAIATPFGKTICIKETLEGIICEAPTGENGFAYDPIFYIPEYNMTYGQMSLMLKNKISHRGKALKKIICELEQLYEDPCH